MNYTVYRHYDKYGRLLYIGSSVHPFARIMQHRSSSWACEISTVTLERFSSKSEMLEAEVSAIDLEMPLHNRVSGMSASGKERWDLSLIQPKTEAGSILKQIMMGENLLSPHQVRARIQCKTDELRGFLSGDVYPSDRVKGMAWRCADIRVPFKAWDEKPKSKERTDD